MKITLDKTDIEMMFNNINYLAKEYDLHNEDRLLGLDVHQEHGGADLVVYDVSDMLEHPIDFEDFKSIVNENALDEEEFEIDRVCLFKNI